MLRLGPKVVSLGAACAVVVLAGCYQPDNGLNKKDYQDLLDRQPGKSVQSKDEPPPIPDLQPILAAPPPPSLSQRLVSVSVTDPSIPVRDVLLELARKAGIDIDVDPSIGGGVILTAKDRPFLEVVDRICDQANLRYAYKDNVLRVEVDRMFHRTYQMDILNSVRTTQTDISTSTDINSVIQGGSSGGGNNASTADVKSTATSDAWLEIDSNIKQILVNSNPLNQPVSSNVGKSGGQGTDAASGTFATKTGAGPSVSYQLGQAPAANGGAIGGTGGGTGAAAPAAPAANPANPIVQAINLADQTASAANADKVVGGGPVGVAATTAGSGSAVYSINKQAGVVSVFATARQHRLVKGYLDKVLAKAGAQVLIEAKVVEISLSDQYNTGVDWMALRQNMMGVGGGISMLSPSINPSATLPALPAGKASNLPSPFGSAGFNVGITSFGGDLAAMINLVKAFGSTRTLSSPRLTVMNNHTAVLKVAENHVYFKLTATVTSTPATTGSSPSQTATYSSQLQTVPIGLVMTVQPSIDAERDQVTLSLRPTVTAWSGETLSDPAVALSLAGACSTSTSSACSQSSISTAINSSSVPVIDVREMESVVTVPSGAVVVMGGLMQEVVNKQDSGLPGAMDVPILGNLFKANSDQTKMTELVVFLKASVVHGAPPVDPSDQDTYKRFMHDPRPLGF